MRKYRITLEVEIPSNEMDDWNDEFILSGIEFTPNVCSTKFDGIKIETKEVVNLENGYHVNMGNHSKKYTFNKNAPYCFLMVDKSRVS